MDDYRLNGNSQQIPPLLYRVQNSDALVEYEDGDFVARDTTTFHTNKYEFKDSVAEHLVWRWWGDIVPSPYISTFAKKSHAENWAKKWCMKREAGTTCKLYTINPSKVPDSYIFYVMDLVNGLRIDLKRMRNGKGIEKSTIEDEYLYLHRIPAEAVEGSRVIGANGPRGNFLPLSARTSPERYELATSPVTPLRQPSSSASASASPSTENSASPYSQISALSQTPLSVYSQNPTSSYLEPKTTRSSPKSTQQRPQNPLHFPNISSTPSEADPAQTRQNISPISQPPEPHSLLHDPFQTGGRINTSLPTSNTTSYRETNNASVSNISHSSPTSSQPNFHRIPHEPARPHPNYPVANTATYGELNSAPNPHIPASASTTSFPISRHAENPRAFDVPSQTSVRTDSRLRASDTTSYRETNDSRLRASDITSHRATVDTSTTRIPHSSPNSYLPQDPVRSDPHSHNTATPPYSELNSTPSPRVSAPVPNPYRPAFSPQRHMDIGSSPPVVEYYGGNLSHRTISPEYSNPAPGPPAPSINPVPSAYTPRASHPYGAQPVRELDGTEAGTGGRERAAHKDPYDSGADFYSQTDQFASTRNPMAPQVRGGRLRRAFRRLFCMGREY